MKANILKIKSTRYAIFHLTSSMRKYLSYLIMICGFLSEINIVLTELDPIKWNIICQVIEKHFKNSHSLFFL